MNKRYEDLEELMSTGEAREVKRAMAVRMSLLGFVRAEVALACCVSVQFVDKWKAIYLASGVEGLKLAYKGSPGYLKPREREAVINWIQEKKTITMEELKRYLKEEYGVFYSSNTSYTKLLEEANLSYKKTHKENSAKDEVKVEAKKKRLRI
ncbi:helix-turn-helix domain-containing protein [Thioflexithrix psekupsensis]|uniref:helix-turn-helix domain-containing protein n=1 Tax=Thioflexithrix psekupsensis TaxID=1570016 RepID=UPI000A3C1890|nr:winged helix-turn-helix domain-containing protein [Thioflexithrix psekupsensis]